MACSLESWNKISHQFVIYSIIVELIGQQVRIWKKLKGHDGEIEGFLAERIETELAAPLKHKLCS